MYIVAIKRKRQLIHVSGVNEKLSIRGYFFFSLSGLSPLLLQFFCGCVFFFCALFLCAYVGGCVCGYGCENLAFGTTWKEKEKVLHAYKFMVSQLTIIYPIIHIQIYITI